MKFDDPVHGFGAAVVGSAGGEVGQERPAPFAQGPSEAGDFGDRAGVEGREDLLGPSLPLGEISCPVGRSEVLGAAPGDVDRLVGLVGLDRGGEAVQLLVGEVGTAARMGDI